ncbi:MAG: GNAT family N-acetyltransferase, partial [Clostridiales bacterium]|nr:GNAT family N-acetyltransferase [Clostridiales bacterium]
MELLKREEYAVERAVLDDAVAHEGGTLLFSDDRGAAVRIGDWHKCVFATPADFKEYAKRYGLTEKVCVMGMPLDAPKTLGFDSVACKTFAYMEGLPPILEGITVKRLAHTLSGVVSENYDCRGHKTPVDKMERIMRDKGVFGALVDSKLAGFIGRHPDGSMGMLTVFENYKRQGIGKELEKFLINYVMTFGRVPFC